MRLGLLVVVINRIVYIESAMYPHGDSMVSLGGLPAINALLQGSQQKELQCIK